jgi:hypothetical protein
LLLWLSPYFVLTVPVFVTQASSEMSLSVASHAVGVGHKKEAFSNVRGTKRRCGYNLPFRIIPVRGKPSEDSVESPISESWYVFHDDVLGSNSANDPRELPPEPASLAVESVSLSGEADIRARKSAAQNLDWRRPSAISVRRSVKGSDIGIGRCVRPVLVQYITAVVVNLDLPGDLESR